MKEKNPEHIYAPGFLLSFLSIYRNYPVVRPNYLVMKLDYPVVKPDYPVMKTNYLVMKPSLFYLSEGNNEPTS